MAGTDAVMCFGPLSLLIPKGSMVEEPWLFLDQCLGHYVNHWGIMMSKNHLQCYHFHLLAFTDSIWLCVFKRNLVTGVLKKLLNVNPHLSEAREMCMDSKLPESPSAGTVLFVMSVKVLTLCRLTEAVRHHISSHWQPLLCLTVPAFHRLHCLSQ